MVLVDSNHRCPGAEFGRAGNWGKQGRFSPPFCHLLTRRLASDWFALTPSTTKSNLRAVPNDQRDWDEMGAASYAGSTLARDFPHVRGVPSRLLTQDFQTLCISGVIKRGQSEGQNLTTCN